MQARARRFSIRLAGICAVLLSTSFAARADGPIVTFFGLAQDSILQPVSGPGGIPTFQVPTGTGFRIVVEGRPGPSGASVGSQSESPDPSNAPDLQIITNRPLGDGVFGPCAKDPPSAGGVAPVMDFSSSQAVIDTLNNFGCRFEDGRGRTMGRGPDDHCLAGQGFVIPNSTIEFCTPVISPVLAFQTGDTVLSVRLRDVTGAVGPVTQIGVFVGDLSSTATPTPTAATTPTPTSTPTGTVVTATPTPTLPSSVCVGDCRGTRIVVINDLITLVNIAVGTAPPSACPHGVPSGAHVDVALLIKAVNSALNGCAGPGVRFVDNGDGTITDAQTGLIWEKKDQGGGLHDVNTVHIWAGICSDSGGTGQCQPDAAAATTCNAATGSAFGCAQCGDTATCNTSGKTTIWEWLDQLNAASFAGHSDWRIPTVGRDGGAAQLETIVSVSGCGVGGPCVPPEFNTGCMPACTVTGCSCTQDGYYWSATTFLADARNGAWYVYFNDGGGVDVSDKTENFSVRAVRGGL